MFNRMVSNTKQYLKQINSELTNVVMLLSEETENVIILVVWNLWDEASKETII